MIIVTLVITKKDEVYIIYEIKWLTDFNWLKFIRYISIMLCGKMYSWGDTFLG